MKLADIFKTATMARVLDLLLENPTLDYLQSDLRHRLNVDKATVRTVVARLQRLGLVAVDVNPAGVHLNAIMFNGETDQSKALLSFYRRIARA